MQVMRCRQTADPTANDHDPWSRLHRAPPLTPGVTSSTTSSTWDSVSSETGCGLGTLVSPNPPQPVPPGGIGRVSQDLIVGGVLSDAWMSTWSVSGDIPVRKLGRILSTLTTHYHSILSAQFYFGLQSGKNGAAHCSVSDRVRASPLRSFAHCGIVGVVLAASGGTATTRWR